MDFSIRVDKTPDSFQGWVVVGPIEDDNPGPVKGHQAVGPGNTTRIRVPLDSNLPPGLYYAILHFDNGKPGVFEYPGGADGPVTVDGHLAMVQFRIRP